MLPIDGTFFHQSTSFWSPVLEKKHTCRYQQVTIVRQPLSSQVPDSQRVSSMKSVFFAWLRVEKPEFSRHPETLCWEEGFVSDAAVWRLAGILSLPGITLPVPVPSQKEQSIEMHWTNFAMLKGQTFALVQCSANIANWWEILPPILFILITSTGEKTHMQVSASDHCETTILFTVSRFAKGQFNE